VGTFESDRSSDFIVLVTSSPSMSLDVSYEMLKVKHNCAKYVISVSLLSLIITVNC